MGKYMEDMGVCIIEKAKEDGVDKDSIDSEKFERYHEKCKKEVK